MSRLHRADDPYASDVVAYVTLRIRLSSRPVEKYPPFCTFKWAVAAPAGTAHIWIFGVASGGGEHVGHGSGELGNVDRTGGIDHDNRTEP